MQINQILINSIKWFKQLKSKVDKLDIGKLETTSVNLSKLSDVVKMKLLKRLDIINKFKKLITLIVLILVIS